jgi:hypothetical protein
LGVEWTPIRDPPRLGLLSAGGLNSECAVAANGELS